MTAHWPTSHHRRHRGWSWVLGILAGALIVWLYWWGYWR